MSIKEVDKAALRRKGDREVLYLVGGFLGVWCLVGLGVYSLVPVIQCSSRTGDIKSACTKALAKTYLPEEMRTDMRTALLDELIAKDEKVEAVKLIDEMAAVGSATADMHSKKAVILQDQGKTEEAATAYREALKLDSTNEYYMTSLVRLNLDAKNYEQARKDAADFLEGSPDSPSALSWAGWVEHSDGKYDAAVDLYAKAITKKPDDSWLYYDLGLIHAQGGKQDLALENYTKAIDIDGTNATFRAKRASLYADKRQHDLAQADYLVALEDNRDVDNLIGLGRSYTDTSDFDKAAAVVDEAIAESENYEWAHDARIRLLYREQKYVEARAAVAVLKGKVPESVYAVYWTAVLDDEDGKDEDALKGYLTAAETWNNDAGMQTDIGHVLLDLDRISEALPHFDKAVTLAPQSVDSYTSRARGKLFMKQWNEALADANTALQLDADSAVAYARRANAEWGMLQTDLAKADYDKALELSGQTKWIRTERIDFLIDSKLFADAESAIQTLRAIDPIAATDWQTRLDTARQTAQ
jgi:tetratricopeptide (TPR) repeat protein